MWLGAAILLQTQPWLKQFELYPPLTSAPAVKLSDADAGKAKSLAKVYRGPAINEASVDNGIVRVTISLEEPELVQAGLRGDSDNRELLADPALQINGQWFRLGDPDSGLRVFNVQGVLFAKAFEYKPIGTLSAIWPPRGMGLKISYAHPAIQGLFIERRLELLDGEPTIHQSVVVRNGSTFPISLQTVQGGADWPPQWLANQELNLVVKPGRVLELPDQWVTVGTNGEPMSMRPTAKAMVMPWQQIKVAAVSSSQELPAVKGKAQVALWIPHSAISWNAPSNAEIEQISEFVKLAKQQKLIPGIEVDISAIPGNPTERTGGEDSPVCWNSLAGRHWRQNALLNWKRLGVEYVRLIGDVPRGCDKIGHDHTNPVAAEFENREAERQFVIAGLGIGVVIQHPEFRIYGTGVTSSE